MPTLLQINACMKFSVGKITQHIGNIAINNGWESWIAYSGRTEATASDSNLIKVGNLLDSCIHYAEDKLLDNEGLSSILATRKLLKTIDTIHPDIVHLHIIHDHWLNYKLLFNYLAKNNIPVVWTQHDQWPTTGHCMYAPSNCERWKYECHHCPFSKKYSLDRSRRNYRLKKNLLSIIPSLTIVAVSEWMGNIICQSHLKDRPVYTIHNGIDIDTFSPQFDNIRQKYGINQDKKIILGVAAVWDARKGLPDFYKLANQLPQDKYTIVIVGKRTKKVKQPADGCQIIFIDRITDASELAKIYSSASVFVNPTYQDNYPPTHLESLACGTPVVTYRTGGGPESIDESTGSIVEPGDINALIQAITHFANGDFTDVCRKKAETHFDYHKCFIPYIHIYNSLLH